MTLTVGKRSNYRQLSCHSRRASIARSVRMLLRGRSVSDGQRWPAARKVDRSAATSYLTNKTVARNLFWEVFLSSLSFPFPTLSFFPSLFRYLSRHRDGSGEVWQLGPRSQRTPLLAVNVVTFLLYKMRACVQMCFFWLFRDNLFTILCRGCFTAGNSPSYGLNNETTLTGLSSSPKV